MKMKQAGLVKKPVVSVPNHLLEQFAREFQQWYPNAKLLVAGKEDFTKERRKYLTAKIASGDWDAIIVTHSSFERIGMSKEYQEQFLNEQIAEYNQLLLDNASKGSARAHRNIIKTLEKQKAAREEKLKDLLAKDKKDDGLTFDELGIDQLFIDEFQAYKRLEAPTKMDRVAGIPTGGSERAFDLYMKARYLDQQHAGHGLVGATGTPITNTLTEMYTLQRYFDPAGLKARGIDHLDGWAATFGEVEDTMEISPDGKTLKPRSRFGKFVNLPELQMMFRGFADVQTAEMLNLPRPKLETGKPIIISCSMSDEQTQLQQGLVKRYERIRSSKVDPREDNALKITTDGRKLALDARLLSTTALTPPQSKLDLMIDIIADRWQRTSGNNGTQLVFCDMGVNPTPWGFCLYDEIVRNLVGRGIPRHQIAVIGDADSDAKKRALFDQVRSGQVRVLIGSTQKMGTGTNVQKKLGALHELDAPWRPDEVEQREGRILRQGNENPEVAIYRYVTEGSFDAFMWQCLQTKAKFINQVMRGDSVGRQAEDIGGQELDYATVKSIASGNPAFMTLAEADTEIKRLSILQRSHASEQFLAGRAKKELPGTIDRLTQRLAGLTADMATLKINDDITIGSRPTGDPVLVLGQALDALPLSVLQDRRVPLGTYHGLRFGMVLHPQWTPEVYLDGAVMRKDSLSRDHQGPRAVLNAVERLARGYRVESERTQQELTVAEGQLRDYQARVGQAFTHAAYLDQIAALRDKLKAGLSGSEQKEGEPTVAELAEKIKALRAANTVEAAPTRAATRRLSAEEPVTLRIRRTAALPESAESEAGPTVPPESTAPAIPGHASPPGTPAHDPGTTPDFSTKAEMTHQERLAPVRRRKEHQAGLF
jgi:hypothetical protein